MALRTPYLLTTLLSKVTSAFYRAIIAEPIRNGITRWRWKPHTDHGSFITWRRHRSDGIVKNYLFNRSVFQLGRFPKPNWASAVISINIYSINVLEVVRVCSWEVSNAIVTVLGRISVWKHSWAHVNFVGSELPAHDDKRGTAFPQKCQLISNWLSGQIGHCSNVELFDDLACGFVESRKLVSWKCKHDGFILWRPQNALNGCRKTSFAQFGAIDVVHLDLRDVVPDGELIALSLKHNFSWVYNVGQCEIWSSWIAEQTWNLLQHGRHAEQKSE